MFVYQRVTEVYPTHLGCTSYAYDNHFLGCTSAHGRNLHIPLHPHKLLINVNDHQPSNTIIPISAVSLMRKTATNWYKMLFFDSSSLTSGKYHNCHLISQGYIMIYLNPEFWIVIIKFQPGWASRLLPLSLPRLEAINQGRLGGISIPAIVRHLRTNGRGGCSRPGELVPILVLLNLLL